MGFKRRKMEDERRRVADKEAADRRATEAQLLEDAERDRRLERAAGKAHADAVLADYRSRHRRLPHHQCD
jgi:hypothetical protein